MSFANLKRSSKAGFSDLQNKLTKTKTGGFDKEDKSNYWKLDVDPKDGSGYAVIRFLPAPENEDDSFVQIYKHAFKDRNTGKWYIENSLTTIGQKDPVSEANSALWNTGIEANQNLVRERKRQKKFYSNIYVVSDPRNPQNEGKVFLYEYGPKIFSAIEAATNPQFADEVAFNPFDLWTGANFKLKAHMVAGQRSYDKSAFEAPSALSDDDKELEAIWKQCHSLAALLDPAAFKSYEDLKRNFERVTGTSVGAVSTPAARASVQQDSDFGGSDPFAELTGQSSRPNVQRQVAAKPAAAEDDDLASYAALLGEDD